MTTSDKAKKPPMVPPTITAAFEDPAVWVGVGGELEVDDEEEEDEVGVGAPGVAEGGPVAKAPMPVAVYAGEGCNRRSGSAMTLHFDVREHRTDGVPVTTLAADR